MKIEQLRWQEKFGWNSDPYQKLKSEADLVLAFGGRQILETNKIFDDLKSFYPKANILTCSTSGEISGTEVFDDTVVSTAIHFERSETKVYSREIKSIDSSQEAGREIARYFPSEGLVHLFVICDGQKVNGSRLVQGINETLPASVSVTGGLAGDGTLFQKTLVGLNDYPQEGRIAAVGFYGSNLRISYGSIGGWDSFGPERLITKSRDNILYELDGRSALELYKNYLGDHAQELPGAALLFPLSIKTDDASEPVVRTILSVDEENNCMIFAGDMPQGAYARLMKANFDRLIEGASVAAENSKQSQSAASSELAVLISCVGRKIVLGQRIEEEVEAVREALGDKAVLAGFYSYGEISPFNPSTKCELHNQTMTITTFNESLS